MDSAWSLARDGADRERVLDMDRRLQPVRRMAFGVVALGLLACGPWLGWWTIVPVAIAAVLFRIADSQIERLAHPENAIFAAWVGSQVVIAISVAMTGGPNVPTISWFAIPIVTLASRFSARGVALGVAITLGLMFAVAFGVDAQAVLDDPTKLIAPVTLVFAVTIFSIALMRSDIEHRSEAVIDPYGDAQPQGSEGPDPGARAAVRGQRRADRRRGRRSRRVQTDQRPARARAR